MRLDPGFHAEVTYCVEHSIPYTTWAGTARRPGRWDARSRAVVAAWRAVEASRCTGCGMLPDGWFDDDGVEVMDHPMHLEVDHCPSCEAKDRFMRVRRDDLDKDGARSTWAMSPGYGA